MEKHNYCLIKNNKIYEELYEMLENEELIMDNPNHKENIKYKIKTLIKKHFNQNFFISTTFLTSNESLEDIMINIAEKTNNESLQGNTILMHANNDAMYEIVYMEQINTDKIDDELNQFASISNIELFPIYGDIAIVKSNYDNEKVMSELINENDIIDLMINNFYHGGVLIDSNDEMNDLEFCGDNPNIVIGNNFKKMTNLECFGLQIVCYNEVGTNKNKLASKLCGEEIKGRLYVTILCPITNKRFWSINIDILQKILKLIDYSNGTEKEKKIIDKINNELNEDKLKNPFFLIKKYCI